MKRLIKTFIFISILSLTVNLFAQDFSQLVLQCAGTAGNVTYLKDFQVTLDASTPGGAPNQARFALMLSKNTRYRFTICNSPNSEGEGILQLLDMNNILGSTYIEQTGRSFQSFDFNCPKTGIYHVFIMFKEGKAGEAVGILSLVSRN